MNDVERWGAVGPVRTMRRELAGWDESRQAWGVPTGVTDATFRPDGRIEASTFHNPDGSLARTAWSYDAGGRLIERQVWMDDGPRSTTRYVYDSLGRRLRTVEVVSDGGTRDVETYRYDSFGRKTRVQFLPQTAGALHVTPDGSEIAYGGTGATTSTTVYDDHDRTSEVQFHDATHRLVYSVVFVRDGEGRTLSEEAVFGGEFPIGQELQSRLAGASAHDRARFTKLVETVFADQRLTRIRYEHDSKGRKVSVTKQMGSLGEDRTTFVYDDHDNVIEECEETRSHAANVNEQGEIVTIEEPATRQCNRLEYQYDSRGNWTERIVSICIGDDEDYRPSNVERRRFTYLLTTPAPQLPSSPAPQLPSSPDPQIPRSPESPDPRSPDPTTPSDL